MSTDFFDHDLRSETRTPVAADEQPGRADTISGRAISRLVEQKHERTNQMAGAVQEIELLRLRQRELEKEKEALESLTHRQEKYEVHKRDAIEKIERCLVVFDKQAAEAARTADLITAVAKQFQDSLQELNSINENTWEPGHFEPQLNKAIVVVEQAHEQYKKGISKVNAASWFKASSNSAELEPLAGSALPVGDFKFWFKAGLAFSLPLLLALGLGFAVWLGVTGALW